jgi:hypothetical protein
MFGYKYGPSVNIPKISTRRLISSDKEVVATAIPQDIIAKAINESFDQGDVNLDNVEIDAENISGESSTIQNLVTNTIKSEESQIRILSRTRFENDILIGLIPHEEDYSLNVLGGMKIEGQKGDLNLDQVKIKDNVIGIGINSDSLDNFTNGFYFPKNDNFTGFGLSIDKAGILTLPYGTFTSDINYEAIADPKLRSRFEDSRASVRLVYINTEYDFNKNKNEENGFSIAEKNFIDSLNNQNEKISNFYLNLESHNLLLHGGSLISGINRDLSLKLTDENNFESEFITLTLSDDKKIKLNQDLKTDKSNFNFNITNSLTFKNINDEILLQLNSNGLDYFSDIIINNQKSIIIGKYNDEYTLKFYREGVIDNNKIMNLTDHTIVYGPGETNGPIFQINNHLDVKTTTLKNYLNYYTIDSNSSINIQYKLTNSIHIIITGTIIAYHNDEDLDNHYYLSFEGSSKNILTKKEISKNNLDLNIDSSYQSNLITLTINNKNDFKIKVSISSKIHSI